MDNQNVSEYMLCFKENVAELRKLGKEWGMTDEEVNNCIDDVVAHQCSSPNIESAASKIWSWFCFGMKIWFWCLVCIPTLILTIWLMGRYHEPTEAVINHVIMEYGYDIFRLARIVTVPIHNYANISHYYDSECIVENPFFREPEIDCTDCKLINKVTEQLSVNATVFKSLSMKQKPIIYRRLLKQNITFSDLKKTYHKNKDLLDSNVYKFESTYADVKELQDVFRDGMEDEILKRNNFAIKWKSRTVKSSQVLRKLFPRLDFIPPESEVALDKLIFIDGPETQHYEMEGSFYPMIWYSQSNGERRIILSPVDYCRGSCDPLQVTVGQGDVLVYNSMVYKASVLPNMKGISIGYQGAFSE